MKNVRKNISHSRFTLFHVKIFDEIVTIFKKCVTGTGNKAQFQGRKVRNKSQNFNFN